MTVVSNTSPITNLAGIQQLDLLHQLYRTITIPQAVYDEMVNIGRTVPGAVEVQTLSWITVQPTKDPNQVTALRAVLDPGEAEAIVLAMELNAELLLIDERPGRAIARQNGIPIIGVLGVLLEAKRQGLIGAVKPPLDQLINQVEFWVDKQLYDAVIKFAGEK
jgi:predicted nucleic acid-binding protein